MAAGRMRVASSQRDVGIQIFYKATSCLLVRAASFRSEHGAGMPREPSGWKPDLHFQTHSQPELCS